MNGICMELGGDERGEYAARESEKNSFITSRQITRRIRLEKYGLSEQNVLKDLTHYFKKAYYRNA